MLKNLIDMDPKAQEEAERERKREAIRQRIAAAKAASAGVAPEESKPEKVESTEKIAITSNEDRIDVGSVEQTARGMPDCAPKNLLPDCYDIEPNSFPTLPLPTKEAGTFCSSYCSTHPSQVLIP